MKLDLTTPALLFPTISLLLLAYTNRFISLANLVRSLHSKYQANPEDVLLYQIKNLRLRLRLIRDMQILGVGSIFLCVLSMFLIFEKQTEAAKYVFGVSLLFLMTSLALSLWEIQISIKALNIQLKDIENTGNIQ